MNFKFTIGQETFTFRSTEEDLWGTFKKEFPTHQLLAEYCDCMDICDCVDGHFVLSEQWETDDPQKPWLGKNVVYRAPLYVEVYTKGSSKFVPYYDPKRGQWW